MSGLMIVWNSGILSHIVLQLIKNNNQHSKKNKNKLTPAVGIVFCTQFSF